MDLETAIDGIADAKKELRSVRGMTDHHYMSKQMDRLAQYASAVEDHLAELEKQLENDDAKSYRQHTKEGKSVSAAEKAAKYDTSELRGQIKRVTRYANSAWRLVGEKQSRYNHMEKAAQGQV